MRQYCRQTKVGGSRQSHLATEIQMSLSVHFLFGPHRLDAVDSRLARPTLPIVDLAG